MSSGCGDVLSLEDLKTAKKHQTFEAEVITGRAGGVSSGAEIDFATNQVTGQVQKTLPAILRDMGFNPAAFDFTTGGTVNARDTVVYNPADNNWYSWAGTLPHVVAPGTNPLLDANWKPRTDQLLRQNLAAVDGAKLIGSCQSLSQLRATEPSFDGQQIKLARAAAGKPTVNATLTYDASDTSSPDDGVSIFVTAGGKRWKADISQGYDIRLTGDLNIDGSGFCAAVIKTRDAIISKIVTAGRVNNITRTIRCVPTNFIREYKVDQSIDIPSILNIDFIGSPFLEAGDFTTGHVLRVSNVQFTTLTKAMFQKETGWKGAASAYLNQAIGNKVFGCSDGGRFTIRGPGYAVVSGSPTITTPAIIFGNDSATDKDCRDVYGADFNIIGFHTGWRWGSYYTYMCGVNNWNISRCWNGFHTPLNFSNFGERMYIHNGTLGNIEHHGTFIEGGGDYTLENVSTDFIGADLVHFGSASPGEYKHLSGHVEGVQGQRAAKDTPTSFSKSLVIFGPSVRFDDRVTSQSDYRGIRQHYGCPGTSFGRVLKVIDQSYAPGREGTKPTTAYPCVTGAPSNTGVDIQLTGATAVDTPYINSYSDAVRNSVNASISFTTASTGALSSNIITTNAAFAASITGDATCVYGTTSDAGADGYMPFILTSNDPSAVIQLFCTNRFRPESGISQLWGAASVRIADAAGNVIAAPVLANYLGNTYTTTLAGSVYTTVATPIERSRPTGGTIDLTALRSGTGLTSADYQAVVPRSVMGYFLGSDFSVAGWQFTGFTGTIYVKLPVWWFKK